MNWRHVGMCVCVLALGACRARGPIGGDGPATIPVPALTIPTDAASIARGEAMFSAKGCASCHSIGRGKLVGPDLKRVTARRTVPWLERMILRPELMIHVDPLAQKLLAKYMAPMGNQHVDPTTELPALLAYLKAQE